MHAMKIYEPHTLLSIPKITIACPRVKQPSSNLLQIKLPTNELGPL